MLIAGGKNKGLDLSPMASEPERMRGVIAIGSAAGDIANAFYDVTPVVPAASMAEAVAAAYALARPGDTVLLSPGCASFDMYSRLPGSGRGLHGTGAGARRANSTTDGTPERSR